METVLIVVYIVVGVAIWVMLAMVAAVLAPDDRRTTFFWLTMAFGPVLGILAAAVASPRDPEYFIPAPRDIAKGRKRYRCASCGAESDLPASKDFRCWRCDDTKCIVVDYE